MAATLPKKFLFICTGNTCRSVMAQWLLDKASRDLGLGLETRSCGVAAERYFQVPSGTRKALAARGVEGFSHTAQLVTRELLAWCDAALALTKAHRDEVLDRYPEFRSKVHVFKTYAGAAGPADVEDPIGQSEMVYETCCVEIGQAIASLLRTHEQPEKPRH